MNIYKRVQFKKREILQLQKDYEDYVWAAIDPSKCIISLGDDYLADLRDVLLVHHSRPENIFGIGFDLNTGEIDFIDQINRRNPSVDASGELSPEDKENIEYALRYFFEKLPAYREA
ncbi:hypothetical protein IKG13_03275 [Candidatus Saccharibacteria bacterium]|nr:hypothetical protein [Candidatus Saccharibacteria bacterium]